MEQAYQANLLPLSANNINQNYFLDELIDATAKLEVYKEKIKDSKLNSACFMPTFQQKEALASSMLEGTQATLDDVLMNKIDSSDKNKNINEVSNYYEATLKGYILLNNSLFTNDFFLRMHEELMSGNVRKPKLIGKYRTTQNYIGTNDSAHSITFIPPKPNDVPILMNNLIDYINDPKDKYRPLVRTAIVHAQFETIHPFMDGNGRVGRMLILMYLFANKQIDRPYFFISEALEKDKIRYYSLLNDIRYKGDWNEWIKFFLSTVASQCDKYINLISAINSLYEKDLKIATSAIKSSSIVDIMNYLYSSPIVTANNVAEQTGIPMTSVNRYLNTLVNKRILYTNNKKRNKKFFYSELLNILR